jgi:hypothetical protein
MQGRYDPQHVQIHKGRLQQPVDQAARSGQSSNKQVNSDKVAWKRPALWNAKEEYRDQQAQGREDSGRRVRNLLTNGVRHHGTQHPQRRPEANH